jgi:hypothetical protein
MKTFKKLCISFRTCTNKSAIITVDRFIRIKTRPDSVIKKIYIWNDVEDSASYKEELLAFDVDFISQDLEKIK